MKKSFKKAGAAVLSMAMLLSMGAISMPVYALPDAMNTHTGEQRPGTVTVHITGLDTNAYHQGEGSGDYDSTNGEGPDTIAKDKYEKNNDGTYTEKYKYLTLNGPDSLDFLKNIEKANVTMYQVATLSNNNGWDWVDYVKSQGSDIPGFVDFASLLANKDGTDDDTKKSSITGEYEFNTASKDLQKMASYLERIVDTLEKDVVNKKAIMDAITDTNSAEYTTAKSNYDSANATLQSMKVGEGTINQSNKTTGVTIPVISPAARDAGGNGDGVLDENEQALTQNKIGYYLIVTKTDQAGTIVQPVLVSLHNNEDKNISVKGSTIQFEKTMSSIYSTDEEKNKGDDRFASTAGSNLKNGLVAKDDIVNYEIVAQLPEYDPLVKQANITDFVIHDTASTGITIVAPTLTEGSGEALTIIDPDEFEVYLATDKDDLNDKSKRWKLTGSTSKNVGDYELKMANGNHGFDLIISGYQMVQEDTRTKQSNGYVNGQADGKVDSVSMIIPDDASLTTQTLNYATRFDTTDKTETVDGETVVTKAAQNKSGASNMYNMYVLVKFKANVNKKADGTNIGTEDDLAFNRKYNKYAEVADVTAEMLNDVGETDLVAGVNDVTAADVTNSKKADALKQILRAQLFNGETRYNMTYNADDYAASNTDFSGLSGETLSTLTAALKATGLFKEEEIVDSWNTDTTSDHKDVSEMCRILVLLARDKNNIELNGEYNTAHLTYGNRYATGGGDVKMTTNYSKVYSVGLKLDKFIETLQIEGIAPVPATVDAYAAFFTKHHADTVKLPYTETVDGETVTKHFEVTLDTIEGTYASGSEGAKATADGTDFANAAYPTELTASETESNNSQYAPGSSTTTLNANQKKLLAYMIGLQNSEATANGKYVVSDENSKQPVIGAIFHLTRIKENNTSTTATEVVKDYGYAVSNANGQLIRFDVTEYDTEAAANAVATTDGKQKFVFKDGDKWYVGFTNKETLEGGQVNYTGDNTWDMLDIGIYEIQEVSVPTGFKKWDKARFEIKADKDTEGEDLFTNSWTGAYSAEGLNIDAATVSTSHGLASIDETKAGKVDFLYYEDKTTGKYNDQTDKAYSDGYLYHELYNEYLDELPATGGMGTVLFTAGGIAVILMAGALFVVYMKKRNAEEEE